MTLWKKSILRGQGSSYLALCEAIADAIASGELRPGDKLPSQRWLSSRLGLALGTVTRAFQEAARRGLVVGEVGRGSFVRHLPPKKLTLVRSRDQSPRLVDLYQNFPPLVPDLETRAWDEAWTAIRRRTDVATLARSSWSELSPRHQRAGARWIRRLGWDVPTDLVLPCPGAQSALCGLLMTLVRPGKKVVSPSLAHPGIQALCQRLSLEIRGLATDAHGLLPSAFESVCREDRPDLLHLGPTLSSPTGATLSLGRRRAIARIARRFDVLIIEEEAPGFLLRDPEPPLASFAPERSFLLADTRDGLSVGLRTSYLSVPREWLPRVSGTLAAVSGVAAPLLAELAGYWIETPWADRLVRARRNELRVRNREATTRLKGYRIRSHPAGLHVWLELPFPLRSEEVVALLDGRGIAVTGGEWFVIGGERTQEGVRISLGSVSGRGELRRALKGIDEALGELRVRISRGPR